MEKKPNGKPKLFITKREIKGCMMSAARDMVKHARQPDVPLKKKDAITQCVQAWIDMNY